MWFTLDVISSWSHYPLTLKPVILLHIAHTYIREGLEPILLSSDTILFVHNSKPDFPPTPKAGTPLSNISST